MPKILLVDDDGPSSRLVELILASSPYELTIRDRAAAALDYIRTELPDLLILDMMLPDMDGWSLYRQVRDIGFNGPVLVMTAHDRQNQAVQQVVEELGEDGILLKPFDPDDLQRRIASILKPQIQSQA